MAAIYIETTVPSYLAAHPSRDPIMHARQQITRQWWDSVLPRHEAFVSELVILEASAGDQDAVRRRLEVMPDTPILRTVPEAENLADKYLKHIDILEGAPRDALHLALASVHGMDYLVTWNCRHIARAQVVRAVSLLNDEEGLLTPTICTPEQFGER